MTSGHSDSGHYEVLYPSSKEKTGDVIMFAQFEEGNILTETLNDAESGDKFNNESIMMSEQDLDAINSGDESDHDLISTEMLEDIRDGVYVTAGRIAIASE